MLATIILMALVTVAALTDLSNRTIPNALSYSGAAAGLVLGAFAGTLSASCLGLAMGLIPGLYLWKHHELGAGDAKLLAAIGALAGATFTLYVWLWSFALAVAVIMYRSARVGVFWVTFRSLVCAAVSPLCAPLRRFCVLSPKLEKSMPMAPCIAVATALMIATGGVL